MISATAIHAARARIAAARRAGETADGGFALILVILVTFMVTSALAIAFGVVEPNISGARDDQANKAALEAAYAGVDDFLALASSKSGCRTTACRALLGTTSSAQGRTTTVGGTKESFSWSTEKNTTADYYIRVHSTGTSGTSTRSITADVMLTNPFLKFGYYSDYETQSGGYISSFFGGHNVDIANSSTASAVNATGYNSSSGKTQSAAATAGTVASWLAPGSAPASNPGYPSLTDDVCNQHWYAETLADGTKVAGRASYTYGSTWSQYGSVGTTTVPYYNSCDVNFVTGITFDGPLYTRDALLVSDGTSGGVGPNFKQPVETLWGTPTYNNPAPSDATKPWRVNAQVGGDINTTGSYKPSNVDATTKLPVTALQLPRDVATSDLPDNACVYYGPTRAYLNGDGTATITSPLTTTRNAGSDINCYPTTSIANGITGFKLNYAAVGTNTIFVKDLGTEPTPTTANPNGWATTGQTSQLAPSTGYPATPAASDKTHYAAAMYLSNPGGASVPDKADTAAAPSAACSSSVKYSAANSATCAWTDVVAIDATATPFSTTAPGGWKAYTDSGTKDPTLTKASTSDAARCSQFTTAAQATDREIFECEYSKTTGNNLPPKDRYTVLRTAVQGALSPGGVMACPASLDTTGYTNQLACYANIVNAKLSPADSGYGTGYTPVSGDHRYVVTAQAAGTSTAGTPVNVGSAPAAPMAGDSLFSSVSSTATEQSTTTPLTLTVSRQTYDCYNTASPYAKYTGTCTGSAHAMGWGDGTNGSATGTGTGIVQFTTTITQTHWAIASQAKGLSYFPSAYDVTQYNAPSSATSAPGDLYVQGNNEGDLSLVADNDAIVTGDVENVSADPSNDAIDIVAGNNVRDYHPVRCADQTAADLDVTKTTPGWCPNDITGLYASQLTNSDGTFKSQHPAAQYVNLLSCADATKACTDGDGFSTSNAAASCPVSTGSTSVAPSNCRQIDAAIFALGGSFLTDNFDRGAPLGSVAINGGLYQSHRGANGIQWEYTSGDPKRASSGANLQYHYVDLQHRGLPFAPAASSDSPVRAWKIVSVSNGGGS